MNKPDITMNVTCTIPSFTFPTKDTHKLSRYRWFSVLSAAFLCVALFSTPACAGWYQVRNYTGFVGSYPVHVSLQNYDELNRGEAGQSKIEGSYYYDAHRRPIALVGTRHADGKLVLCEVTPPDTLGDSPVVPKPIPARPNPCPMELSVDSGKVTGLWNDGRKSLVIHLQEVAQLDDTDDKSQEIKPAGEMEIPMWYHTKRYLLIGVYQQTQDCKSSMRKLRFINIRTGKMDNEMAFECGAGTVATTIFRNVWQGSNDKHVTIEFPGGFNNMGEDRDVLTE
ncbi:hypothetical protein [Rahnella bonaserana]|jgi:hypothetical protein|uniref:hypothetical protein n=1 Tax=Rahnella bonaserana TaxID=2816248 RepID=UPI003209AFF1